MGYFTYFLEKNRSLPNCLIAIVMKTDDNSQLSSHSAGDSLMCTKFMNILMVHVVFLLWAVAEDAHSSNKKKKIKLIAMG